MEDSMRSFFTGWNSGDALAQSDNSRYTQYGNTALNNTGAQNREMLGHINTLQKYYMTKRGPDGQPLDQESMDMLDAFINAKQVPFSQGVMVPGDRDVPAGMPPLFSMATPPMETPVLPTPPPTAIPPVYPNRTGPDFRIGPYPLTPPPTAIPPVYPNRTGPDFRIGPYPLQQQQNPYPDGAGPAAPAQMLPQMPTVPPPIKMPPAPAAPQKRKKKVQQNTIMENNPWNKYRTSRMQDVQ